MPTSIVQPSFSCGEVSPAIYPRVDLNRYFTSLKTCRNFIIHPQGGASNRPGTRYVASTKYSDKKAILKPFIFASDEAYVLEVGHEYMRFFTEEAQVDAVNHTSWNSGTTYDIGDYVTEYLYGGDPDIIQNNYLWADCPIGHWFYDDYKQGQQFTLNTPTYIESVSVYFGNTVGSPVGDVRISIQTLSSGKPTGTLADANAYADITPTQNAWNSVSFTPFQLAAGQYAIVISYNTTQVGNNYWQIARDPYNHYSGGEFLNYTSGLWYVFSSMDLAFKVITQDTTNYMYRCKISNTNKAPGSNPSYWEQQTVYEISTPYSEEDLGGLRFEGSADVIYITHPDYQPMTLSRYGIADWRLEAFEPDNGPFMPKNIDASLSLNVAAVTGTTTLTAASALFDTAHVGALFKLVHYVEGQKVASAMASVTQTTSISCFSTWRLITHGTWTGKITVEKSSDGGTTWTEIRSFSSSNDYNVDTYGTEDIYAEPKPFLVRINMYAYTSGTCNVDLTTDPFYHEGIVRATGYVSSITLNVDVIDDLAATTQTIDWSEGSWSNYRGWPAVGRFYKDRFCCSSTYSEPMTTWMSEIGIYDSFLMNQDVLASDAISVNLPSRQLNAINGLVALKRLIAFTSSSEWMIGGSQDGILSPDTVNQDLIGYRGSYGIEPVMIGDECIFALPTGRTIRNLEYQLAYDTLRGANLNVMSEHLFDRRYIEQMVFQQEPDSIVWLVRDDYIMLGMTYLPEQEVVAWHWHDTDGDIESLCVIPYENNNQMWMIVNRTNGRFVEFMERRLESLDIEDQVFLDSCISFTGTLTTNFSGLDHLVGENIGVLADGEVIYNGKTPHTLAAATLTLNTAATDVLIGLPYLCDLETLGVEVQTKEGTLQGRKVRIGGVTFRVSNTRGGYIGPDSSHLYDAFPTLIASKISAAGLAVDSLYTGDIRPLLGAGYENNGRVFYRQYDPLPVTIGAVIPEVEPGERTST